MSATVVSICALLMVLLARPAMACTPMLSVGFPAVLVAWFLWIAMAPFVRLSHPRLSSRVSQMWAYAVPAGMFAFVAPTFAIFVLPAVILFLAFPSYLAVEALAAAFGYVPGEDRVAAMVWFGLPAATLLGLGVAAKYAFYSHNGGIRRFLWNYEQAGVFFIITLGLGLILVANKLVARWRAA